MSCVDFVEPFFATCSPCCAAKLRRTVQQCNSNSIKFSTNGFALLHSFIVPSWNEKQWGILISLTSEYPAMSHLSWGSERDAASLNPRHSESNHKYKSGKHNGIMHCSRIFTLQVELSLFFVFVDKQQRYSYATSGTFADLTTHGPSSFLVCELQVLPATLDLSNGFKSWSMEDVKANAPNSITPSWDPHARIAWSLWWPASVRALCPVELKLRLWNCALEEQDMFRSILQPATHKVVKQRQKLTPCLAKASLGPMTLHSLVKHRQTGRNKMMQEAQLCSDHEEEARDVK